MHISQDFTVQGVLGLACTGQSVYFFRYILVFIRYIVVVVVVALCEIVHKVGPPH